MMFVFLALLMTLTVIGSLVSCHSGRKVRLGVDWDAVYVGLQAAERSWERQRRERIKDRARKQLCQDLKKTLVA